jgi:hypothetical protein
MTDQLTDEAVKALLDGATENAYDLEVVKWGGGIRCVYLNDYRVAGEKPWGGGDTTRRFKVRMADIMRAFRGTVQAAAPDLARALLDARAERAAAQQREARLRAALEYYADTFCEGFCKDLPQAGTYQPEMDLDCSGCKARATLAQTPTDPGDGWTWHERLGWIGPDGKPADPRRRG